MQNIRRIWSFYINAHTKYDIHSPYISTLINELRRPLNRNDLTQIQLVEFERKNLLKDHCKIVLEPMGAGSKLKEEAEISVRQLAAKSLSTQPQCLTYYKLIKWLQPMTILELGTSLGISTLYHHFAAPDARLISIEGRSSVHSIAQDVINRNKRGAKIEVHQGLFDDHLEEILTTMSKVDYVFIDGDHRGASLIRYLRQILPFTHPDSVIVLHDIYWSDDMLHTWKKIIAWHQIKASLDLYEMGILLLNPSILQKQNISLISTWFKPWRQGLFF